MRFFEENGHLINPHFSCRCDITRCYMKEREREKVIIRQILSATTLTLSMWFYIIIDILSFTSLFWISITIG